MTIGGLLADLVVINRIVTNLPPKQSICDHWSYAIRAAPMVKHAQKPTKFVTLRLKRNHWRYTICVVPIVKNGGLQEKT